MSDSKEAFEKFRRLWPQLNDTEKALFFLHTIVAPLIFLAAATAAFGWAGFWMCTAYFLRKYSA